MSKRFYIERLIVTGRNVKQASLKFDNGVNLIIGSSDTGKSYIYQCLDYLLGAGNCPKDIPESTGYSEAYLQIRTNDNRVFTIFRNLKTVSKISVTESTFENYSSSQKMTLGDRNDTLNGDNISEFLLKLMGVENVSLKVNAQNKTKKLSFRHIALLTLIDESRIITEGSPVYAAMDNYYNLTLEKSVFRYLLTEKVDNELIEVEEKKVYESRIKGKMELIASLVLSKNKIIDEIQHNLLNLSIDEINTEVSNLLIKLETSTKRIEVLTTRRETIFNETQNSKSSKLQNTELLKRFHLLREHYTNDLNRLNFILEGEFLFKQLMSKDCPVCGTKMDEEHLKCLAKNIENKAIVESVKIEGEKIEIKLKDLEETIKTTEEYDRKIDIEIGRLDNELSSIVTELNLELFPLQQNFQTQINHLIKYSRSEQEIISAKKDITSLSNHKGELEGELLSKSKPELATVDLEYTVLKIFSEYVERYLSAWRFPGLTTVEFDRAHRVFDLSISGRGRNSHGKGVRAISYSAFTFGLLDYCIEQSKPHPGFIVLDSPLTTYHNNQKRENGDEVNSNMQESFFLNIVGIKKDRQVIILDNKIPPSSIVDKINYIQFSNQENSIRKGFFP